MCLIPVEACTLMRSLVCVVFSLQPVLARNQGSILSEGKRFLCFLQCVLSPVQWVMGALSRSISRSGHEAENYSPV